MGGIDPTVPASRDSAPGAELAAGAMIGRYRLVTRLGAGAMGVVWSAEDPQLERKVAIKLVHPMLARSPDASERLLREARAMAKLSHRAVVTVHDAGEVDGRLFLAMELVPGTTLGQMLRVRSPAQVSDWQRWLVMMIEAGQGLAAAHEKGVLHRDFKPDNVLVDAGGRVCVADFGLATLGHINEAGASQPMELRDIELTTTGALVGTPMYMSAEQLRGAPIDARADQFAFCVALYEALYDARPFPIDAQGVDAIALLRELIEDGHIAPAPPGTSVPDEIRRAVIRGLAAKPGDRWPTLAALLAQLSRAAGLSTLREAPPSPPPVRRARWPYHLAALALLAGATALVIAFARRAAPTHKREPEQLFGVATHTVLAVSPDGKRIAIGNDTLEVRELGGRKKILSTPVASREVSYLELDANEVRFSQRSPTVLSRWHYAGDGAVERGPDYDGAWFGTTVAGAIVGHETELRIVADGRIVRRRAIGARVDVAIASPDRRRVAFIAPARFSGKIVVWDVDADTAIESPRLDSPTALDWLDDGTLVYATGVYAEPTLWRVPLTAAGFGERVQIYSQHFGWFGNLRVYRDPAAPIIYAVDMRPSARTREIERTQTGRTVHDFDTATTTVALGWLDNHEFLAWARDTGIVERRTAAARVAKTGVVLPSEPANATRAGDTLIASLRTVKGREVVAYSLAGDGKPLWRAPDLLAVRCAGDRQAPCFAVIALADSEQVVAIDPATGVLGTEILYTGTVEDIAVTTAGDVIHVSDRATGVVHIDPRGKVLGATHAANQPWVRSIACTIDGTLLVGGTAFRNVYQVGMITGGSYELLTETENDILSLVRPSDDGSSVLFLARTFAPEVFRLPTQ